MNQIPVFQTNSDGLFLYQAVAHEFPLQPGVFNVPYGAKLTPPPDAPAGQIAQAIGDGWRLVEDHREQSFYRTDTAEPYEVGQAVLIGEQVVRYPGWDVVPAWLTAAVPPAPGSTWDGSQWIPPEVEEEPPAGGDAEAGE